jgi:hypothetical protein
VLIGIDCDSAGVSAVTDRDLSNHKRARSSRAARGGFYENFLRIGLKLITVLPWCGTNLAELPAGGTSSNKSASAESATGLLHQIEGVASPAALVTD